VVAWQKLPAWSGTGPLQAWLTGIARHKVGDYYRRRLHGLAPWEELNSEIADVSQPSFDLVIDRERDAGRALAIIAELPETYRLILRWRYWDGMGVNQIAEHTGRTGKAVERLLARAREQFRRRWQNE